MPPGRRGVDTLSDAPPVRLSVVVCTLDRAELLDGCLRAVLADRPRDGSVEVVVVDNGSTDDTPAVVASHDGVRYVIEPRRGLARARNAGLAAAAAGMVAFLDDDARSMPGWTAALLHARERWPTAVAIGGPVVLEWGAPRPAWLVPALTRWFSAVDHGPAARLLDPNEQPVGANLTVARDPALAVGGFAPELGRMGASLASEEEVDLLRRLRATGGEVAWEPAAAVRHLVPPERMTRRWIVRRAWAQGRSDRTAARLAGELSRRDVRLALRALVRGWPSAVRMIRSAEVRSGAITQEVVRRARRLARALH
ncbi:MAG: glycosyltransferase family 2 protein [Microthrixaceae bacterium]